MAHISFSIPSLNKDGVPLFYPSPARAVMPKNDKWRITPGSKAEIVLLAVFSILALLLLPLNRAGLFPSLHGLLADTHSAITDFRAWGNTHRVVATIGGELNVSQQPIEGEFEVLGVRMPTA